MVELKEMEWGGEKKKTCAPRFKQFSGNSRKRTFGPRYLEIKSEENPR